MLIIRSLKDLTLQHPVCIWADLLEAEAVGVQEVTENDEGIMVAADGTTREVTVEDVTMIEVMREATIVVGHPAPMLVREGLDATIGPDLGLDPQDTDTEYKLVSGRNVQHK